MNILKTTGFIIILLFIQACGRIENEKSTIQQTNWESKKSEVLNFDNYTQGKTYLPVYSHIYHIHEHRTFDLTITASIRNVSETDSLYILKADYYNTVGEKIRQYLESPIFLKPLETIEIVIAEEDVEGGSGANFIFDWATPKDKNAPLFEAVMISTNGQQGLSFSTRGIKIEE